jgi:predicted phosphohydrolase
MRVFAISDLHLAKSISKPMDVFGGDWKNYMERIETNWRSTVDEGDYVIVPGDVSWATYLDQVFEDFRFLDSLPGRKIISKGNHDYWWNSIKKLNEYVEANNFSTISFLHNNSFNIGGVVICGTRGWKCPGDDSFGADDRKIYERELIRLELSLKSAVDIKNKTVIAALHFPPTDRNGTPTGFTEIMARYGVDICVYGHLHDDAGRAYEGICRGIDFKFVAADYLSFTPLLLCREMGQ